MATKRTRVRGTDAKCDGSGRHKTWKRGFIFDGERWRCRACRVETRG